MESVKIVRERAKDMIERDEARVHMQNEMDKMWHMDWELPSALKKLRWVRKIISSDPHDAVRAGMRVFSSISPRLKITSLAADKINRDKTDELERGLLWMLELAFNRKGRPLSEILKQAMLYDMVCAQVVHVDSQKKIMGEFSSKQRGRNAKRSGPFAVILRQPQNVHVDISDFGLERVLYRTIKPLNEVVAFWGDAAKKLTKKDKKPKDYDHVAIYDYHDYNQRYVWAFLQGKNETMIDPSGEGPVTLLREKNTLDFLPWAIKTGGEELIPLLYSVFKTGQWDDQNMLETMVFSESISMFAAPRLMKTGPGEVKVEYGTPGRILNVPIGTEVDDIPIPSLDPSLLELSNRTLERIEKSTVPRVITVGDVPSGAAFATLDLQTRSGVKSLTPYRDLAQDALGEIFRLMFYWISNTSEKIYAYPVVSQTVEEAEGITQEDIEEGLVDNDTMLNLDRRVSATKPILITKDDFDVDHLYIDVELAEDVATDRLQRINAAILANRELKMSRRSALEEIAIQDPGAELEMWQDEQDYDMYRELGRFQMQSDIQREEEIETMEQEGMVQLRLQDQMVAAQQDQQMMAQEQMAAEQPPQDLFAPASGAPFEATQGQGWDPAMGGVPPAAAFPAGTRETQAEERARTVATQAEGGGE